MSEPNWYIVLEQFYEADGRVDIWDETTNEDEFDSEHEFWSGTDLSSDEIHDAIIYLEEAELLDSGFSGMSLTNDGFKAVYERKNAELQTGLNRGLLALTFVLALGTVVQTAIDLASSSDPSTYSVLLLGGEVVIFAAVYFDLYRRGLLDFEY
jgi:hypothetical protein